MKEPATTGVQLWGISEVATVDGPQSLAISFEDFENDVDAARDVLESLGAAAGESILVVSTFAESGTYAPLFEAGGRLGAVVSCAEATEADSFRVAMLVRVLPRLRAVVAVNGAALDGLEASGHDLVQVFGGVPVVAARPGAWRRLCNIGVPARLWAQLGPALAVECAERSGAHLGALWRVRIDGDNVLHVEPRVERACGTRTWTPVGRWSLTEGGCPCGRSGQRVAVLD